MNKRKKEIVEHCLALFLDKGIQNTSVQHIIDRAGISKGTFYNYFTSKNECIRAILEQNRLEADVNRDELLIGKDPQDLNLLIEQITVKVMVDEKRGMNAIYEEIFYSGDRELKQLVLEQRIIELKWLAQRLVEVYGEALRPHAFESSVIFYGILQHLLLARKLTHDRTKNMKTIAASIFYYMESIIHGLIHHQTAVLDYERTLILTEQSNNPVIKRTDVIDGVRELLQVSTLSKSQKDLAQALDDELDRPHLRDAVLQAILGPFKEAFEGTPHEQTAKEIAVMAWQLLKLRK